MNLFANFRQCRRRIEENDTYDKHSNQTFLLSPKRDEKNMSLTQRGDQESKANKPVM
jgi:hypothetical protein